MLFRPGQRRRATRPSAASQPEYPALPEGMRVYVIGDIHGRSDLLGRMRELIEADLSRARARETSIVLLGDYIDRGPDSCGVVESLSTGMFPIPTVPLRGNHEAMMLQVLAGQDGGENWIRFGGLETLLSYGITLEQVRDQRGTPALAEALKQAVPAGHRAFLEELRPFHEVPGYVFCHAGVRPGVAIQDQREEDLLWIREEFLCSENPFGGIVVHGHTPALEPSLRVNAIGIDTGAYATGRLTCLVLSESSPSFLST